MSNKLVYNSMDWSIYAQVVTGILGFAGLEIKLENKHNILEKALELELIVQVIELAFYIFFLRKLAVENMAAVRYFDWVITTPIMLFTTVVYFKYEEYIENSQYKLLESLTLRSFFNENKDDVQNIMLFNFLMVLFGYLGETGKIGKIEGFVLGTIFFLMAFRIIYTKFAEKSKIGKAMFQILFAVWSLYGIAYLMDTNTKNTMFNGLDVIAKNFFGVFLFYKINGLKTNASE